MSSVYFSICYFFLMCELLKIGFFLEIWWIINVQIFSLLLRLIWVQNTLTHEKTLHAKFLYHWHLYCIVLTDCAWNAYMHLFMGHIVSSLHMLKERIFVFMCILNLFFKFGLCCFIFAHLQNFPKNLFCFFNFYRRRKLFLQLTLFIRGVFALHRESGLYFP